jgi:hypothetical protein
MSRLLPAIVVVMSLGCGTVLNSGPATIVPPPGGTVDGVAGPLLVSKKTPHEIRYPDGRACIIQSRISMGYLLADIFLLFLVGVVVDAVTDDWKVLDPMSCPGVIVQ